MMGAIRFQVGAIAASLLVLCGSRAAQAGAVDVRCPDMPPPVRDELEARIVLTMDTAGVRWSHLAVECDGYGVWIVWFDGSRALVDQRGGLVSGAIALVESRISYDRYNAPVASAQPVPDVPPRPDLEEPPREQPSQPDTAKSDRKKGTEGGIGAGMSTEFWGSSAVGIGPRLDVAVGPPGVLAFLLSESALFGTGAASSSQITMFDFQAGVAFGAPYKVRSGFGGLVLVGAERIAAANSRSDSGSLWEWNATLDLGARGSFKLNAVNMWLGADLMLRSSGFDVGGSTPVSIPSTSFMLSAGGFVPAFAPGSSGE
jgi:hypothetical protein